VPALLCGVAFGNLFLGLPFHFDELERPVFTGGFFGLLHPFALLVGVVSLAMLVMHGSVYAALKLGEPMAARAAATGRVAALIFIAAFVIAGVWVAGPIEGQQISSAIDTLAPANPLMKHVTVSRGAWLGNFRAHHLLWLAPALAVLDATLTWALLRVGRAGLAFFSSATAVAATILTAAIALFPFLLPSSTHPDHGLTVWDASSSARTLGIMLVATVVFLPVVLAYTAWVYTVLRGRITLESVRQHGGQY
jgi:cytochrome bd ubiquinol oxidase subunit II